MPFSRDYRATEHGQVNRLHVTIQPAAPNYDQARLQLKNLLLYAGIALKGVNERAPLEMLKANGPDVVKRVAVHIVKYQTLWADVLATVEALVASEKLKLNVSQIELLISLIKEACYQTSIAYKTE